MIQNRKPSILFLKHKYFFLLSLYFLCWFFFSWIHLGTLPPVWPDEVLFFSPAWDLFHTGNLRSFVLVGLIPGMESKTLWMPPGLMLAEQPFFYFFSNPLIAIRIYALVSCFFTTIAFLFVLRKLGFKKEATTLAVISILLEPLFFRFGGTARMESLSAFFVLVSFLFLINRTFSTLFSFLGGLAFSFACLSHPFALSLGLPLGYLYLSRESRRVLSIGIGILGFSLPLFAWFYYIDPDWDLLKIQFGAQLIRKKTLLENLSLLDKFKIFFFAFGLPKIRMGWLFAYLGLLVACSLAFVYKNRKIPYHLGFLLVWLVSTVFAIFSSSEGWYVFHFLFPMAFGIAVLVDWNKRFLAFIGIVISLLSQVLFFKLHWIDVDSKKIWQNQVEALSSLVEPHQKIYLQTLPDPFFVLQKKFPDKQFLEFIPGELEFPSEEYQKTLREQDVFVFYNETLMNPSIQKILSESQNWERTEWQIPVPKDHWYHFKTIVYARKKN